MSKKENDTVAKPSFPADFGKLTYNADNKKKFLSAGRKLLKAVGEQLKSEGLIDDYVVRVNQAGIAVGGDVDLEVVAHDPRFGGLITLTHSIIAGRRRDGVICYAQHRSASPVDLQRGKLVRGMIVGNNMSPSGEISFESICALARQTIERHPELRAAIPVNELRKPTRPRMH